MRLPSLWFAWAILLTGSGFAADAIAGRHDFLSPDGRLKGRLEVVAANPAYPEVGQLTWSLELDGVRVVDPSPLGVTLDGVDLGRGSVPGEPQASTVREVYPWRGIKSSATNHARIYHVPLRHRATSLDWQIEVRVFDDGFAYRYRVPGKDGAEHFIIGESSSWTFTAGSTVWLQTNTSDYEGAYHAVRAEELPLTESTDQGPRDVFLGPPATAVLPGGGYLLVTEANLVRYSGLTLRPQGGRQVRAAFQDDPQGFFVKGEIVTPWRVSVVARDLNALVNSDVVPSLCEPPDPKLFPEGVRTPWVRPGKSLITWCVFGNDGAQWPLQKWFVDQCAALRCEYLLIDAGWRTERWGWLKNGGDVWARLKEICDYGATRGVGIVVWHAFPEGRDDGPGLTLPESRRELFRRCEQAGVRGVKIDFFNSERKGVVEAYEDLARLAAEHHLLINFHGAHKPTGEVRTWPNEITREGLREQEYVLWQPMPLEHYAALPFTRWVVGHSDFLPTYVRAQYLRNTTATFQMATAVISHSSFVSWPDHPDDYRASVFLGLMQTLPLVWDETRVLPGTAVGEVVALARRSGNDWYVAVLNGRAEPRAWELSLDFLSPGPFVSTWYRDAAPRPTGVAIEVGREVASTNRLTAELAGGGGWVGWIRPKPVW